MTPHNKNWSAICSERDTVLQYLAATATDERVLHGLRSGFPEFFQTDQAPVRVPISILWQYAAGGLYADESESGVLDLLYNWLGAVEATGIPIAHDWRGAQSMPGEIVDVLESWQAGTPPLYSLCGERVQLAGCLYVLVALDVEHICGSGCSQRGKAGHQTVIHRFTLINAEHVVFEP